MRNILWDSFWCKHCLCHISHTRKVAESSFHGLKEKSSLFTSTETLFYDKTMPEGSYCAAFGCSHNSYSKEQ